MDEEEQVITAIVCEFDDLLLHVGRAQALIFATCMLISVPVRINFYLYDRFGENLYSFCAFFGGDRKVGRGDAGNGMGKSFMYVNLANNTYSCKSELKILPQLTSTHAVCARTPSTI